MPRSVTFPATDDDDTTDPRARLLPPDETTEDDPLPSLTAPSSPVFSRRSHAPRNLRRTSENDVHSRMPSRALHLDLDENTSLLGSQEAGTQSRNYNTASAPGTPGLRPPSRSNFGGLGRGSRPLSRQQSFTPGLRTRNHSRANSWGGAHAGSQHHRMLSFSGHATGTGMGNGSSILQDRVWYDQFTSTDWVHDSIADGLRVRALKSRRDVRGRFIAWFDGAQGWILVAIIGCIVALIAYFVDLMESAIFDLKEGYCSTGWYLSKSKCCAGFDNCTHFLRWSEVLIPIAGRKEQDNTLVDFAAFVAWCVLLAVLACLLTMITKTVVPSAVSLATLDENLGADRSNRAVIEDSDSDDEDNEYPKMSNSVYSNHAEGATLPSKPSDMVYYPAAGSGVAEVKVINSGFVMHGYLGVRTLVVKTLALILSVASGLSLGKEGPFVHIATCVGNIACRLFSKYNYNDGKRREVLSASAASGVAVAFGAPIGAVLFSLEEVSYYFPPKTLFRTFFCCIASALSLKFLNPYGTGKIVLFEVRYITDWQVFEILTFVLLGVLGGTLGALFIKASRLWATSFRRIPIIKKYPLLEVVLVAFVTGVISFWNRYTKLPVTELLLELASPCSQVNNYGLCPLEEGIPEVIRYLLVAFVIKAFLTVVTFGIKVPAGIYVPSMVVGGLMGRIVGHCVQYLVLNFPNFVVFSSCPNEPGIESCVTPGVYALVAAGATMCGVTRLSVTLAVILFELTGSLDHVLPFSLAVLTAKWTADAIEPLSIYVSVYVIGLDMRIAADNMQDLLTDMNSYPFLDNKVQPNFDSVLGDIVRPVRARRIIDISNSPLVPASELRQKLELMLLVGELDGGLPILRRGILVGLIPAPDLEFALDQVAESLGEDHDSLCLMAPDISWAPVDLDDNNPNNESQSPTNGTGANGADPTDFTQYIDSAPIALDVRSPMDVVFQCFAKLGLRYVCVLKDGMFAGMVHKKSFVKYVREFEEEERRSRRRESMGKC